MLSCFGDESADDKSEWVFAVAGVLGTEEQWQQLEAKWIDRCGGVPFHASDCDSDHGDYTDKPHQENKDLYRDVAILLAESGMGGMGIALDLVAARKVFRHAEPGLPYYKCFLELVQRIKNCAAYNKETVKFTFDMRPKGESTTALLYSIAKRTKQWNPYIDSEISFACSRKNARIQVADLWARETMKGVDNMTGPKPRDPRKSLMCLAETERFHVDIFGEDWFQGLRENMPELEKITHMSARDYGQWLVDTKRLTDSMTNRFHYMQYVMDRDGETS